MWFSPSGIAGTIVFSGTNIHTTGPRVGVNRGSPTKSKPKFRAGKIPTHALLTTDNNAETRVQCWLFLTKKTRANPKLKSTAVYSDKTDRRAYISRVLIAVQIL